MVACLLVSNGRRRAAALLALAITIRHAGGCELEPAALRSLQLEILFRAGGGRRCLCRESLAQLWNEHLGGHAGGQTRNRLTVATD